MRSRNQTRRGFTLVEMLVAVTLVLLMMSMFAQIFQIAGGSITKQRGIAENDQRTRTFQNVLKADLDKRTFRLVMPWAAGEDGTLAESRGPERAGYLYISENDPNSALDDFLQFTTNVYILTKNKNTDPYFGKATKLPADNNVALNTNPNQPEADDSQPVINGTTQSAAAEVAYFLRGSNLYRRVLLIREPLDLTNAQAQPTYTTNPVRDAFDWNDTSTLPAAYPQTGGISGSSTFWNDFDSSAFYGMLPSDNTRYGARFHGFEDLDNASPATSFPLGNPAYRFGFNPVTAHSREWSSNGFFLGRYTHEETSHPNFNYPQALANFAVVGTTADPTNANTVVNVDVNPAPLPYRIVQDFSGGPRRGEDLILANVHMFDVKVWDENANGGLGAFVDIGNDGSTALTAGGDLTFLPAKNWHRANGIGFGSDLNTGADADNDGLGNENRVFDTWHPNVSVDFDGSGTVTATERHPPYRLQKFRSNVDLVTTSSANSLPPWSGGLMASVGTTKVFPTGSNTGRRFYYVCVQAGTTDATLPTAIEPVWPRTVGGRVTDGTVIWEAVENWKPLRALQITVRFYDVTSNQMRQNTLVHSLID